MSDFQGRRRSRTAIGAIEIALDVTQLLVSVGLLKFGRRCDVFYGSHGSVYHPFNPINP